MTKMNEEVAQLAILTSYLRNWQWKAKKWSLKGRDPQKGPLPFILFIFTHA
uniref:hypothetical protein n=1 Tax=Angelakisella sp. TaxID=1935177 RepID=UPI0040265A4C